MSRKPLSSAEIHKRAKLGLALNLRELAVALGYSARTLQQWKADGLPLVDGKLPVKEAWAWRKKFLREQPQASPQESSVSHLVPEVLRR